MPDGASDSLNALPLERFRPEFELALRSAIKGSDLPLYDMVRYHMGWQDSAGNPSDRPGKILRPLFCLLTTEVVGGEYRQALPAGVAIELMHNFSLIHDDIQDGDEQRHGRETVWKVWGTAQAINAGDLLWAIANRTLAGAQSSGWPAEIVAIALDSLNYAAVRMIEGQYMDLAFEDQHDVGLEAYQQMTSRKTGALFGAALELGALAGGLSDDEALRFRSCGEKLGVAFQAHDDVLGIWGDSAQTGKSASNDLARRKKTLPVVHALASAEGPDHELLGASFAAGVGSGASVAELRGVLDRCRSQAFTSDLARQLLNDAFSEIAGVPLDADRLAELRRSADLLVARTN